MPNKPSEEYEGARALNSALVALLTACEDLCAWIDAPNRSMSEDTLRRIDNTLLHQLRSSMRAVAVFDPSDAVTTDLLVADACNTAVYETTDQAGAWIDDFVQAMEKDARMPDAVAAEWAEKGYALADRVRALTAEGT